MQPILQAPHARDYDARMSQTRRTPGPPSHTDVIADGASKMPAVTPRAISAGSVGSGARPKRPRSSAPPPDSGELRLSIDTLGELFDSLDPAPHYERDLDAHAEQFLVDWASEKPKDVPLHLNIHMRHWPPEASAEDWIQDAVRHHFEEMARLTRGEFHALLRTGRTSLAIGLGFLMLCVMSGNVLAGLLPGNTWPQLVRETLSIGGSVAMWRPMQIYLYDWWPLKAQENLFRRMSRMRVELHPAANAQTQA